MSKISVIIPIYNTGKYLAECLDSVLAQTLSDIEIICINDGSTDNSAEILAKYEKKDSRIKTINIKNQGVVVARNIGVANAQSELIFPLDSDDIIDPTTLEKLYSHFMSGDGDIITCRVMMFGEKLGELVLAKPTKLNMSKNNCLVNAALLKKSDFLKCGGYSEDCKIALEDYDLWLNLLFKHNKKIYRVQEILFYYRIKDKSESRNWQHREEHERLVKNMYNKYPNIKIYSRIESIIKNFHKFVHFFFRIKNNQIRIFKTPIFTLKKYNCVISIGAACFVPEALKNLNLRKFSGPFDWMHGSDVLTRLNCVYNEFKDYFNYDDFEYLEENPENGKAIYRNIKTGIIYNHDFEPGDFKRTFPPVAEKYKRRTERMINHLIKDKNVLLIFAEFMKTGNKEEILNIMNDINYKFPANIDLLYINNNPDIKLGDFSKPKRISKNVIYSEYHYYKFPDETPIARKLTEKIIKKIIKKSI